LKQKRRRGDIIAKAYLVLKMAGGPNVADVARARMGKIGPPADHRDQVGLHRLVPQPKGLHHKRTEVVGDGAQLAAATMREVLDQVAPDLCETSI